MGIFFTEFLKKTDCVIRALHYITDSLYFIIEQHVVDHYVHRKCSVYMGPQAQLGFTYPVGSCAGNRFQQFVFLSDRSVTLGLLTQRRNIKPALTIIKIIFVKKWNFVWEPYLVAFKARPLTCFLERFHYSSLLSTQSFHVHIWLATVVDIYRWRYYLSDLDFYLFLCFSQILLQTYRLWKKIPISMAQKFTESVQKNFPLHDNVIKWKHFPRYWPLVRGSHWPSVNSLYKGQWREAFMLSFICAWINGWVNNLETGDLRRHRAHYGVTLMIGINR